MMGLWLLVPELQRLQVWDLLCGWTGTSGEQIDPRVSLQLLNEAALCIRSTRKSRTFNLRGFELASGLPYIATDQAIHGLLEPQRMAQTQNLQVALGQIRRASGHFQGRVLALDPHRMPSYSKRRMVLKRPGPQAKARKVSQCFFCLDAATSQPVCCTLGSSSRTATTAAIELMDISQKVLNTAPGSCLVMGDSEHFTTELVSYVHNQTPYDLLVPIPSRPCYNKIHEQLSEEDFTTQWAGFATATTPFSFQESPQEQFFCFTQRIGERPGDYDYRSFLCTRSINEVKALTEDYPGRWNVEEFFNFYQDIGWKRAGTMNLNIRYADMTMALIAQAATYQLRNRVGEKISKWNSMHLARNLFQGLDGDLRVKDDTVVVTLYNADRFDLPESEFTHMPQRLENEGVDPRVPWLYNFKVDFRFR